MCGPKSKKFVTGFDQLGLPISLNLNGQGEHQTFTGGCCSIFVIFLLLTIFTSEMIRVFGQLNYDTTSSYSYLGCQTAELFTISTDDVVPTFQIVSYQFDNSTLTLTDYVTPFI